MDIKQAVEHKRFLLDLIDDPELAVCHYRIGSSEKRKEVVETLQAIVSKHVANLKNDLVQGELETKGINIICNISCDG